jgi:hypothetical protein
MKKGPIARFLDSLWRTDWGLTFLLFFLVVGLFVAPALISADLLSPRLIDLTFALMLVSGVATVSRRGAATLVAAAVAIVAVLSRGARILAPGEVLLLLDTSLAIVAVLVLTTLVLIQVFRQGPITYHRIQGAIAAYLLLGLAWANAYELLEVVRPGALRYPEGGGPSPVRLVYFSFVTLTTVGYGDITPVHPVARTLAISEALVGQLFPAILIGRLVSMELATRYERVAGGSSRRGGGDRNG